MKAAIVDVASGELVTDRFRIDTPQPATPLAMAAVVNDLVTHFSWTARVGVGFPAVVRNGVVHSAANIDESWIDVDADALFTAAAGVRVHMINDADAAGLAEVRFGAGRGCRGVVMMLTFGTGIGSGLFIDGVLVPNTELGHLELDGVDAETRAAASARKRDDLSGRGGPSGSRRICATSSGSSRPTCSSSVAAPASRRVNGCRGCEVDTEVVAAQMANNAGIVGAALVAPAP